MTGFHPQCVADVQRTLEKTCGGCLAKAARNRTGDETIRGYLLCAAASLLPSRQRAGRESR